MLEEPGHGGRKTTPGAGTNFFTDARIVITAFPHPVFLYGSDRVIVSASPAAERMIGGSLEGLSIEEVVACLGICHPDGTPIAPCDLPAARVLGGEESVESPFLITAADGSRFSIRASASRILRDGFMVGVLSVWSDVTDLAEALALESRRRTEAEFLAREREALVETLALQNEAFLAQEEELRQHLDAFALSRHALQVSEQRVLRTLERLLSPGIDLPDLELADLIDLDTMQELLDVFRRLTGVVAAIVDPGGRTIVGDPLRSCDTDVQPLHPETLPDCFESCLVLSEEIPAGESRLYRCGNDLWGIATPITLGGRRLATLISGQFDLADDEKKVQVLDEDADVAGIGKAPRLERETVEGATAFLRRLAGLISSLGYSNLRLARALVERDALTTSLERNRDLLARAEQIAHLGSWELDLATHDLSWSDEVFRILGFSPDEIEPGFDALIDAAHPDDREAVKLAYSALHREGHGGSGFEHRIIRRGSGEVRWIYEKWDIQRDTTTRSARLVGLYQDITDRKQVEQSLQEYAARLQASNEELQRFAYVASHDLQEPLRSIVSFSQLLDRRYHGRLDADADEFLGYIVEGGRRMQVLIKDLLLVSQVEMRARPKEPVDTFAMVDGLLRTFGLSREDGTIEIEPLPVVMADPSQLELVFQNLIGNALKYHRPGVPARVRIWAERAGPFWRFSIQDNGIGIEPEYFDRIFVMFQRLHTQDRYDGTGIGLAIVKKVVERHGGGVRVESVPGEGSTFSFTLPAR